MKKKQRKRKENFADSQAANLGLESTSLQALGAQNEELHQEYMVRNKNRHHLLKKEKVFVRMRVACELRKKLPKRGAQPFTGCVCLSCLFCFYTTAISAHAERELLAICCRSTFSLCSRSGTQSVRCPPSHSGWIFCPYLHRAGNTFTHKPSRVSPVTESREVDNKTL